jgi:aromatic-L-amino-acid decarboxylase
VAPADEKNIAPGGGTHTPTPGSPPDSPLEPPRALAERWLQVLGGLALDHVDRLEAALAGGLPPAESAQVVREVSQPIGEEPLAGGIERIAALLERAASAALCAPGPGYLAYVPGGGIYAAALADLVADVFNRYTGINAPAPALFRLEEDVLRWLCREFGYGPAARALLTPGGSLSTLEAVVAARHQAFGDGGDFSRAVVFSSTQAHHSVAKAVRAAGIPDGNLRMLPVDGLFRLRPDSLASALAEERARGRRPFLVVASAGTTNTGAIDPLPALADTCAAHGLWLHVDAAYGGGFVLTDAGRARLVGIERADSICFDPHKSLFLPYGTGCLLVRDGQTLRRTYDISAAYLQQLSGPGHGHPGDPPASWSPHELGPELTRDFRGLRLWLPLMLHGAAAFRRELAEKLELAERFVAGLDQLVAAGLPVEITARPQLSAVAFRLRRRPEEPLASWNQRNAAWLAAINGRQRVHLSSTRLETATQDGGPDGGEVFTLRVCVLSFRTHARHIDRCLEDLAATIPGEAPAPVR